MPPSVPSSVLINSLVREGQREKKMRICHIATSSFNILNNFLCLVQVMRQPNSFNHTQMTFLATEQSHGSCVLRLPTTKQVYSYLIILFFMLALTSNFFCKTSFPFKGKASSKHLTNGRIYPVTPAMSRMHPLLRHFG